MAFFYTSRSYIVTLFGYLTQALDYANLALIIDISDCECVYRRVWTYFHLQQYGDAICDLHISEKVDEDNSALEALNRAEHLLPGCLSNFQNKVGISRISTYRGMIYNKLGEYTKALESLNRAIVIQVSNHDVVPIAERGLLYYSMGEL